jgi:hypothetical protein
MEEIDTDPAATHMKAKSRAKTLYTIEDGLS